MSVGMESERERLDAIERTQVSLRNNIEASKALIRRSEALLDDCRKRHREVAEVPREAQA